MTSDEKAWQRLSLDFGLCIPIADLRAPPPPLVLALHLGEYRPFYLAREEDELARKRLQDHLGLFIVGRPLSGKTRMALEAMLAIAPDAYLLRINSPQQLSKLDALVIPRVLIGRKKEKPSFVVFLDDIEELDGAPLDELVDRLYPQVSKLYIVATCGSGAVLRVLSSASLKALLAGPLLPSRAVEIKPLTAIQAMEVEKEAWKIDPGRDLGLDRTEVGVILLGSKLLASSYGKLDGYDRGVLRSLYLAEFCAFPCPKDILQSVVERVVKETALPLFNDTVDKLVEADVVKSDDLSRLSIASDVYRDEVTKAHYSLTSSLRQDLRSIELMLEEKGEALHLTALGVSYGERLNDLPGARRVLEASLKLDRHRDTLLSLSLVLARSGDKRAAQTTLEEVLQVLSEPDSQAHLLIRFGDELLKEGSAAAIPYYMRSSDLAQSQATKIAAAFRCGDAFFFDNAFEKAEPIYREYLNRTAETAKHISAARLVVSIIGQRHFERAAHDLRQLLHLRPQGFRDLTAAAVLENGENRFLLDERISLLRKLVWKAIRDTAEGQTRAADLLASAVNMIDCGFLSAAKEAYSELRVMTEDLNFDSLQRSEVLNNLAICHLFSREPKEARPLFEETLSLLYSIAKVPDYFPAAALAGLAGCDLLEGDLQKAKKGYEQVLQLGKKAHNDTINVWAHLGLGEIAWEEGNASSAHENFFAIRNVTSDVETLVRADLGRARVSLHFGWLDDAAFHIARGLATCVRVDYGHRKKEFETLKQQLEVAHSDKRKFEPVTDRDRIAVDALIMKGGGVKGLAFAGAIRELENYFKFDTFVGTSAGSIAAALLAAGATGADLEHELRKKPFRDFLDGNRFLRIPFTNLAWGGHRGETLVNWLKILLYPHLKMVADVAMKDLHRRGKRAVIYASSEVAGPITFDSIGEGRDTAVHAAVRYSISIPLFFEQKFFDERPVYDGGLLNNYPVQIFLGQEAKRNPPVFPKFIALYLGSDQPIQVRRRSQFARVLSIWIDRNDAKLIDEYREHTVLIDTEPIGTLDFDLTELEKDLLVLQGRAAALEFLKERGGILDQSRIPEVESTSAVAEELRVKVKAIKQKRRLRRWAVAIAAGVAIAVLGFRVFYRLFAG
jgi:predicted acylesterase/phospholipase RssA